MSGRVRRRVQVAWVADGVGTATVAVSVSVAVTQRFGAAVAGLLALSAVVGRLVGVWLASWAARHRWVLRCASWSVVALAVVVVLVSVHAPPLLLAVLLALSAAGQLVVSGQLAAASKAAVVSSTSLGMCGQASAALVVAACWAYPFGRLVALVCVLLQVVVPFVLLSAHVPPDVTLRQVSSFSLWRSMRSPLLWALVSYGPLALYATLTVVLLSPAWVGVVAVAYAVGSLCAARLDRVLPDAGWVLPLLACGSWLPWLWGDVPVVVVVLRIGAGASMFCLQGRLLRRVAAWHDGAVPRAQVMSSAMAALGFGTSAGAALLGVVVSKVGLPVAAWCGFGVCVAGTSLFEFHRSRSTPAAALEAVAVV